MLSLGEGRGTLIEAVKWESPNRRTKQLKIADAQESCHSLRFANEQHASDGMYRAEQGEGADPVELID